MLLEQKNCDKKQALSIAGVKFHINLKRYLEEEF